MYVTSLKAGCYGKCFLAFGKIRTGDPEESPLHPRILP